MIRPHKDDPTAVRRTALRARFDRIFSRITGFTDLDAAVARLHANKDELLLVLDRPDIPLHTNGSENAVRSFVTKRRISGETRSAAGKQARDTFLSLLKTCSKHATSFWEYLGARLTRRAAQQKSRTLISCPGSPISSGRTPQRSPAQTTMTAICRRN